LLKRTAILTGWQMSYIFKYPSNKTPCLSALFLSELCGKNKPQSSQRSHKDHRGSKMF
jgi:hypothetical protein